MELELRNVSGKGKGFCLQNISMTVKEGFITGLAGKNGAGKTTLFHTIMDEEAAYTGEILVDGEDIRQNRAHYRNVMAFISDEKIFFMEQSAMENARLLATLFDSFSEEVFLKSMHRMGVSSGSVLKKMSRGEFLRFQMAFALAHDTKLYLLDEVTAGMDPIFRKDFFKLLHEMIAEKEVTVLMSTHIQEEMEIHMDYVGVLDNGKLVSYKEAGEE